MGITKKKKITQLPTADSVSGSEWVEIVQDGVNKKALAGQVAASGGALPPGGSAGEVLAKASETNYDTEWVPPGGGSDRRTVTALTSSSGIVTIDYEPSGDYFTLEPTENISGFIVTNPPTDGACIGIEITQGATPRTVVFGAEYQFTASSPLDTVPSGAGEKALLFMTTFNGGSMWWLTMDTLA